MGQLISVETRTVGNVALFDTNRSVTGQDGESFDSQDAAAGAGTLPGELASRLFSGDPSIGHVFVMSNGVSSSRDGGWDQPSLDAASAVIREFFVFYRDDGPAAGGG